MERNDCHLSFCYSHYIVAYSRFFYGLFTFYFQERVRRNRVIFIWKSNHFFCSYTTDGTIALFVGALPLLLPDRNPSQSMCISIEGERFLFPSMICLGDWEYQPILPWNHLSKTFPWGVFMLQGAGLAIADGFKVNYSNLNWLFFLFSFLIDEMYL